MALPSWSRGAIEKARREGLYLVKLEVSGKYAKDASMSISAPVGPEMARKFKQLFAELSDLSKRLQ